MQTNRRLCILSALTNMITIMIMLNPIAMIAMTTVLSTKQMRKAAFTTLN
jgi:hypothetical protein